MAVHRLKILTGKNNNAIIEIVQRRRGTRKVRTAIEGFNSLVQKELISNPKFDEKGFQVDPGKKFDEKNPNHVKEIEAKLNAIANVHAEKALREVSKEDFWTTKFEEHQIKALLGKMDRVRAKHAKLGNYIALHPAIEAELLRETSKKGFKTIAEISSHLSGQQVTTKELTGGITPKTVRANLTKQLNYWKALLEKKLKKREFERTKGKTREQEFFYTIDSDVSPNDRSQTIVYLENGNTVKETIALITAIKQFRVQKIILNSRGEIEFQELTRDYPRQTRKRF